MAQSRPRCLYTEQPTGEGPDSSGLDLQRWELSRPFSQIHKSHLVGGQPCSGSRSQVGAQRAPMRFLLLPLYINYRVTAIAC